jgi:hypothetical protein
VSIGVTTRDWRMFLDTIGSIKFDDPVVGFSLVL